MGMTDFHTKKKAEAGIKLPLTKPCGEQTKEWIKIRSTLSESFRDANQNCHANAIIISSIKDDEERKAALDKAKLELLASLVCGWSFKQKATVENVIAFLDEAPQIAEEINKSSANLKLFFTPKPKNSTPSQKKA